MKCFVVLSLMLFSLTARAELYSCTTERNEEVVLSADVDVDTFNPTSDEGERLACVKAQDSLVEEVAYHNGKHSRPPRRVVHRSCWPDGTTCRGQDCYDHCCHSSGGYTSILFYNCG